MMEPMMKTVANYD